MSPSTPALVNPDLLAWARMQAGYSLSDAASKIGVNEARLLSWEAGPERPSVAKARDLAKLYRRPLALFFLNQPPNAYDLLRDFRRLPGTFRREESPSLLWAIRQARYRRQVALDLIREGNEDLPRFSGKTTLATKPEELGARMRRQLGISVEQQRRFHNPYEALNAWREALESNGVLVFQSSRISMKEMRAVCLPEDPLPAILLNGADHPHGRVFSLLHELAHLLLVRGGVIGTKEEKRLRPEDQQIEVFVNGSAGAALLPREDFLSDSLVVTQGESSEWPEDVLSKLSNRYSVSKEVILRRLVILGVAREEIYQRRKQDWEEAAKLKPERVQEGAPPVPVRTLSQVGKAFARLVLDSYHRGAITMNDVSNYFDMKPKWIPEFEQHMAGANPRWSSI